MMNWIDL